MATSNVTIRMDSELKKQAEELFADLGLNMTTAMIAFTKQAVREQRIPFTLKRNIPNIETLEAIVEAQKIVTGEIEAKEYTDVDEMFEDILNEV
ncbi:MAG: DNA protein [Eubacteriaceae bacterium]|nr:DNA protein [Eubacteriaceae bacterium]MDK2962382.1 DNA protein [Eubacteriaceae bacterium]